MAVSVVKSVVRAKPSIESFHPSVHTPSMGKTPRRKQVGEKRKGKRKDKNGPLHDKQRSINRMEIDIARKQERLAKLKKEEASLKAGKTVNIGK